VRCCVRGFVCSSRCFGDDNANEDGENVDGDEIPWNPSVAFIWKGKLNSPFKFGETSSLSNRVDEISA
jgi:hypothetical protein